jgi:toxin FitB
MYLLDTKVVSELRRAKKAHPSVRMWAQNLPAASLYLSAISILELEIGVLLMERHDRKQPDQDFQSCPTRNRQQ